jgi:phosphoglycerate transport regulatory protein PgtC
VPHLRTLCAAVALILTTTGTVFGLESRVAVVTSYPEEMMSRFEAAFERANPGVDVQFIWKQSRDALPYLQGAGREEADVYWAPSPATFQTLANEGAFAPLTVARADLPGRIGGQPLSDPQGRFEAFEAAGYGVAWSPAAFAKLGLPAPEDWRALADAELRGALALPIPGQVGFAPALYDVMLQAEGWEGGWALLRRAAAGAALIGNGGQTTQTVVSGQAAAAPTIDFFVQSAIADGHPVALTYPKRTAFLPAHIALLTTAPRPEAARAFIDFALSAQGQRLLFAPDIRRHPVRPAVYADAPPGVVNPFAALDPSFVYDPDVYVPDKGRLRAGVIAALFDRAITVRHDRLKALWAAIDAAPAQQQAEAARLAVLIPVSEAEAEAVADTFRRRDDPAQEARAAEIEKEWDARFDALEQQASAVAFRGGATVGGERR